MSKVWDTLIEIQHLLEESFEKTGVETFEPGMDRFNQPGWVNRVWTSDKYRRAHVDVVDARLTKGLWMMHCCIFPHTHNPAPIYGFDVIAGKNKITGCFHDYSKAGDPDHPMMQWFADQVAQLEWRKERALPEWATNIFSKVMTQAIFNCRCIVSSIQTLFMLVVHAFANCFLRSLVPLMLGLRRRNSAIAAESAWSTACC
jgi:hypothetical protein